MRVLITGGAGFIGSTIADRLCARGDDVLSLDDFTTGRRDNLVERPNLHVVEGSITDEQLVDHTWATFRPDVVVHAAASYKDPSAWSQDALTNAVGTARVVEASRRQCIGRLIYFQTALCYGLFPDEQPVTLEHDLRPADSSYAISKTAGEYYVRLSDLDWVSFRLANGYGPRNITGPLPTFYSRLTNGKPVFVVDTRRDFVFVDDLVDVVVRAIDGEGAPGAYHISTGSDYSIEELLEATLGALGIDLPEPVEVRPRGEDDAFTILLDPTRTREAFPGWSAETPLEEGVAKAVEYYQRHGVGETFTHLRLPAEQ